MAVTQAVFETFESGNNVGARLLEKPPVLCRMILNVTF